MFRQRALLSSLIYIMLSSCTPSGVQDYKKAQDEIQKGHYHIALSYLDKAIKRDPTTPTAVKAAREAARISMYELKDYKKAITYNRALILNSPDQAERKQTQKQIASIFFDNLQNYAEAVIEYNKLIETTETDAEKAKYKIVIARANYYTSAFQQANSEIAEVLKLKIDEDTRFSALALRGNILVAQKDYLKAADLFKKLLKDYPTKSQQENLVITLAVCYEESGNFKEAISLLEKAKTSSPPEYIELRIKRLKERQKNLPGARGLRK